MDNNKPASFKDIIYRTFLRYAIVPAFSIALTGVLITFGILGYTTIDMTKAANKEIGREVAGTIESYQGFLLALADRSDLVTQPVDSATRVKIFEKVYHLSNYLGYKAKLYIFNKENEAVLTSTGELPPGLTGDAMANWSIFWEMNHAPDRTGMKVVQDIKDQYSSIYIGRAIKDGDEIAGYAVFTIESSEFQQLLAGFSPQTMITDSFGWIYLTNNYDFYDNLERISREYKLKNGYMSYGNKSFYMASADFLDNQLHVYTMSDVGSQLTAFKWIIVLLVLMFIVIRFSLTRGAAKVSRESTKDIDIIADAFEQVKAGNLNNYISIYSSEEFQTIGESYNLMIDSLKEQIEKNKEMIGHMAFAQIKQLESQINPHFLFNTLENIRVMCKIDVAKVDKMIVNLSSYLRYSISNVEEDVTVRRDIENLQNYLSILKIRFNRRFQYAIEIDEEVMDLVIPKLLVQPLVENSIKYGFGDRDVLSIEIKGYRNGDNLILIYKDDGIGIDEDTLKELKYSLTQSQNPSDHQGLYNIHKRINLKYKGDYGIAFESKPDQGVTFTLMLPVCRKNA